MKMFSKMLRDEWVKLLAFFVFMSAVSVVQIVFWPTFEKLLPSIMEVVPKKLQWLVGAMQREGFVYFTMTQQLMKNVGMFGSALAIILGASAVAKEIEAGTMELLLAQPISRMRVLAEKYLFNLGVLAIPLLFSTVLVYPAALFIGENISLTALLVAGLYCFSLVAVIYSFAFFLGVLVDTQMQVIVVSLAVCLIMMILAVFKSTSFLSLFSYMDLVILRAIFISAQVPLLEIFAFALVCAAFFAGAVWRFRKKTI
ncbi:MAG: ABC transporter permease subunit [Deltaproteobacteria bacterium]|nr:ABC transporter permease subunit [Deltaproteobacteria bacterium]